MAHFTFSVNDSTLNLKKMIFDLSSYILGQKQQHSVKIRYTRQKLIFVYKIQIHDQITKEYLFYRLDIGGLVGKTEVIYVMGLEFESSMGILFFIL